MYNILKRFFDIIASVFALCGLSPLMLIIAIIIRVTSRGHVLFRQERVGKDFKIFRIYKFRTMIHKADRKGPLISTKDDSRITAFGHFLRKYKLDELPQLINVLSGDMSIVGPRPEVQQYVKHYEKDYREILKIKPGISCIASIKYRHESKILNGVPDPEEFYLRKILPEKIRYYKIYLKNQKIGVDLMIILNTLFSIIKK
jgi:lipopolysaccharide/colanic/teichoic acid biosynthesis glycosyltransferase